MLLADVSMSARDHHSLHIPGTDAGFGIVHSDRLGAEISGKQNANHGMVDFDGRLRFLVATAGLARVVAAFGQAEAAEVAHALGHLVLEGGDERHRDRVWQRMGKV